LFNFRLAYILYLTISNEARAVAVVRPLSTAKVGRVGQEGICPFYEWSLEHCYHIQARGAEVLRVISHCFANFKACEKYGSFARTPEGAAELTSRNIAFQAAQYSK